jgi:hypothetical protein
LVRYLKFITGALLFVGLSLTFARCGEDHNLTDEPISMDIYVDSTFSNKDVASECMPDVLAAVELAAGSRGTLKFHTFDGDPFRRRGLSRSFGEETLPADIKGTSGETSYLEKQAQELEVQISELIAEPPSVGGTPLIELLERAGRHPASPAGINRILICTDGLFTDVNPLEMNEQKARSAGESLPKSLSGVTIDFIGLDGSAPGRGRRIEDTKPLVEALLGGAGANLGTWDLELGPHWREELIAAADGGTA